MIILYEFLFFCVLFFFMVLYMMKDPIKTLYNYPPKIQERVKSLDMYKDKIPTMKNMFLMKSIACIVWLIVIVLVLRYINGCDTFLSAFSTGLLLWTLVNVFDALVMDIGWFCHSKRVILPGTEDMKEYKDYWFHIKESLKGELIGIVVCALAGIIIHVLF